MKKLSILITSFMLFALLLSSCTSTISNVTLRLGDYVQMGRYYDEPILWCCVDVDENGPLMLAERILTLKPFDAPGNSQYLDGTAQVETNDYRTSSGSNLWETSNMRSWLNSTSSEGNVTWPDGCPPTQDKVFEGYNDYATEKGFMADGNFSAIERSAIKSVNQKSLLDELDVSKLSVGGTAIHPWKSRISDVVSNYDIAFYHTVTDKMFLLDVKQVNRVYKNSGMLGANYYIGIPTERAIVNSETKRRDLMEKDIWSYWLRTPEAVFKFGNAIRSVGSDGYVGANLAWGVSGVRPAFYLNLSTAVFQSGNGQIGTPYLVKGEGLNFILILGVVVGLLFLALIGLIMIRKKGKRTVG